MMQPPAYPPHPGYAPYPAYPPKLVPLEAIFSRAWTLLRANWTIALVPIAAGAVCLLALIPYLAGIFTFMAQTLRHPDVAPAFPTWVFGYFALAYLVVIVVALCSITMIFGMADAAWARGSATFADGFAAVRSCTGAMFVAGIGFIGLGIAAVILALPTLFVSFLALLVFTMYVLPAVVSGGRGGFEAISESFRLVRRSFGRSAIGIFMLIALQYALSFVMYPVMLPVMIPFQTALINAKPGDPSAILTALPSVPVLVVCAAALGILSLLSYAYYAYYALTLTGMYRSVAFPEDPALAVATPAGEATAG